MPRSTSVIITKHTPARSNVALPPGDPAIDVILDNETTIRRPNKIPRIWLAFILAFIPLFFSVIYQLFLYVLNQSSSWWIALSVTFVSAVVIFLVRLFWDRTVYINDVRAHKVSDRLFYLDRDAWIGDDIRLVYCEVGERVRDS